MYPCEMGRERVQQCHIEYSDITCSVGVFNIPRTTIFHPMCLDEAIRCLFRVPGSTLEANLGVFYDAGATTPLNH